MCLKHEASSFFNELIFNNIIIIRLSVKEYNFLSVKFQKF